MHLSPGRSSMSETAVTTQGVRLSRRRFLRLAIAVPSAGVIALQTACGGKRTAGGADAIVQTLNSEGDRTFDPGEVTVVRFNKVIWQNVSKNTVHTITCDPAKAKDPSAVSLPQGALLFRHALGRCAGVVPLSSGFFGEPGSGGFARFDLSTARDQFGLLSLDVRNSVCQKVAASLRLIGLFRCGGERMLLHLTLRARRREPPLRGIQRGSTNFRTLRCRLEARLRFVELLRRLNDQS